MDGNSSKVNVNHTWKKCLLGIASGLIVLMISCSLARRMWTPISWTTTAQSFLLSKHSPSPCRHLRLGCSSEAARKLTSAVLRELAPSSNPTNFHQQARGLWKGDCIVGEMHQWQRVAQQSITVGEVYTFNPFEAEAAALRRSRTASLSSCTVPNYVPHLFWPNIHLVKTFCCLLSSLVTLIDFQSWHGIDAVA